jgi:hypothetical protein
MVTQRKMLIVRVTAQAAIAVLCIAAGCAGIQGVPLAHYVFCFLLYKRSVTRALPTVCQ